MVYVAENVFKYASIAPARALNDKDLVGSMRVHGAFINKMCWILFLFSDLLHTAPLWLIYSLFGCRRKSNACNAHRFIFYTLSIARQAILKINLHFYVSAIHIIRNYSQDWFYAYVHKRSYGPLLREMGVQDVNKRISDCMWLMSTIAWTSTDGLAVVYTKFSKAFDRVHHDLIVGQLFDMSVSYF